MDRLLFKVVLGQDNKYRFSILLADALVVTDGKCYDSITDVLDGIKTFNFVLDQTFVILQGTDALKNFDKGLPV